MIEGLKLRITSAELKDHMMKRSAHHAERADLMEAQLPRVREAADLLANLSEQSMNPTSVSNFTKGGNYNHDPEQQYDILVSDIKDRRFKTLYFKYMADHLFDDDYTLLEADLIRLEILKRQ